MGYMIMLYTTNTAEPAAKTACVEQNPESSDHFP